MSNKIVYINNKKFVCNGDKRNSLGHPVRYLIINPENKQTSCPYCSVTYIYNDKNIS